MTTKFRKALIEELSKKTEDAYIGKLYATHVELALGEDFDLEKLEKAISESEDKLQAQEGFENFTNEQQADFMAAELSSFVENEREARSKRDLSAQFEAGLKDTCKFTEELFQVEFAEIRRECPYDDEKGIDSEFRRKCAQRRIKNWKKRKQKPDVQNDLEPESVSNVNPNQQTQQEEQEMPQIDLVDVVLALDRAGFFQTRAGLRKAPHTQAELDQIELVFDQVDADWSSDFSELWKESWNTLMKQQGGPTHFLTEIEAMLLKKSIKSGQLGKIPKWIAWAKEFEYAQLREQTVEDGYAKCFEALNGRGKTNGKSSEDEALFKKVAQLRNLATLEEVENLLIELPEKGSKAYQSVLSAKPIGAGTLKSYREIPHGLAIADIFNLHRYANDISLQDAEEIEELLDGVTDEQLHEIGNNLRVAGARKLFAKREAIRRAAQEALEKESEVESASGEPEGSPQNEDEASSSADSEPQATEPKVGEEEFDEDFLAFMRRLK